MADLTNNSLNTDVDRVRNLNEVVREVSRIAEEQPPSVAENDHQLRRLIQSFRNKQGRFGLFFAICNLKPLRRKLTRKVKDALSDQPPVEILFTGNEESLLDKLLEAPGAPNPLVVYGIEKFFDSSGNPTAQMKLRSEHTIQEMQMRREQFRRLGRPLLLWMPEYVYSIIGQQAVDFWSWQAGAFIFSELKEETLSKPYAAGRSLQGAVVLPDARKAAVRLKDLNLFDFDAMGREKDIRRLIEILSSGKSVLIYGESGQGKTSLAIHLARQLEGYDPDIQFFVSLDQAADSVTEALREIVLTLHPTARLPKTRASLITRYRSVMEDRRAVIVVDEPADFSSACAFLTPAGSVVIITSRAPIDLPGVHQFRMAGIGRDEAIKIITTIASRIGEHAGTLAELCDYHPLKMRLAASTFANRHDLSVEQFLQQVAAARRFEYLVALAYESLGNETQRMWRNLTIFPETFDDKAAAAIWEITPDSAQDTLGLLAGYGLVEVGGAVKQTKRYRLDKTLRSFAAPRLSKAEHECIQRRHARHYRDILAEAERLYREGGNSVRKGLDLFDAERTNIETGLKWAEARANRDGSDAQLYVRYFDASFYVLDLRQHPHDRIRWLQLALETARRLKWHKSEFDVLRSLGNAYRYLSETQKAIDYFEQALKIRPESDGQGGEFIGEGFVLGRLGLAYDELGKAEKAFEYYEKAWRVDQERDDQADKVITLSDCGYAEFNRGNLREAIGLYRACRINRELPNPIGVEKLPPLV